MHFRLQESYLQNLFLIFSGLTWRERTEKGKRLQVASAPPGPADEDTIQRSLFSSSPSSSCSPALLSLWHLPGEERRRRGRGKKKTGIEVNPSVNKAASESNFGEKRQSQHEGGAVKGQVQADESGTGEALGWRDQR